MDKCLSEALRASEPGPAGGLPVKSPSSNPGQGLRPPADGDDGGPGDDGDGGGDVEEAQYSGKMLHGLRHGRGRLTWPDGQTYAGDFFRDRCHGAGEHTWPDGSRFRGRFYLGRREGRGTLTFPDGSTFTGLYENDRRSGPGVRSYADGRQDAGIWLGERLVKLCIDLPNIAPALWPPQEVTSPVAATPQEVTSPAAATAQQVTSPGGNAVKPFRERDHVSAVHGQQEVTSYAAGQESPAEWDSPPRGMPAGGTAPAVGTENRAEMEHGAEHRDASSDGDAAVESDGFDEELMKQVLADPLGYRFHEVALRDSAVLPPGMERYCTDAPHLPLTASYLAACDARFYTAQEARAGRGGAGWRDRRIALGTRLGGHARTRGRAGAVPPCRPGLGPLRGRAGLGPPGPLEEASRRLLEAAAAGDCAALRALASEAAHPDVGDAGGRAGLHAAAAGCHGDAVHQLLDRGADVNALTDDGVSPLLACLALYYAQEEPPAREEDPTASRQEGARPSSPWGPPLPPSPSGPPPRASPSDSGVDVRGRSSESREEPRRRGEETDARRAAPRGKAAAAAPDSALASVASLDSRAGRRPPDLERSRRIGRRTSDARGRVGRVGLEDGEDGEDGEGRSASSEFRSTATLRGFALAVSDKELELSAEALSRLRRDGARGGDAHDGGGGGCGGGARLEEEEEGLARKLAARKHRRRRLWATVLLLLSRGADPGVGGGGVGGTPGAVLLAVRAGDARALRLLLERGAPPDQRLPPQMGGTPALLVAAGTAGSRGVTLVSLLLSAAADPDIRAPDTDTSFFPPDEGADRTVCGVAVPQGAGRPQPTSTEGGQTALHVACQRSDNQQAVVRLLLQHGASTEAIWAGHSPLSLAVACGNLPAVEELLTAGADPSRALPRGVGNALCAAANPSYSHGGLATDALLALIERLLAAGADVLAPVRVRDGARLAVGTVVDFAFMRFQQDRRVAHAPFHALSPAERELFSRRRAVLAHLGAALRRAAVARERRRLQELTARGVTTVGPSKRFVYTGAGATVPAASGPRFGRPSSPRSFRRGASCAAVGNGDGSVALSGDKIVRRFSQRFCYGCGRAVGVRLAPCSRCREVLFCSRACTTAAWAAGHRAECLRVPDHRGERRKGKAGGAPGGKTAVPPAMPSCSENYSFN